MSVHICMCVQVYACLSTCHTNEKVVFIKALRSISVIIHYTPTRPYTYTHSYTHTDSLILAPTHLQQFNARISYSHPQTITNIPWQLFPFYCSKIHINRCQSVCVCIWIAEYVFILFYFRQYIIYEYTGKHIV